MSKSKLPIRENPYHKILKSTANLDAKIDEKKTQLTPQMSAAEKLPVVAESNASNSSIRPKASEIAGSSKGARKEYEKAQRIGSAIGQKISSLLEHIRKKQTASDSTSHPDNAIPIMKKLLRRDLTTRNLPPEQKDVFPQFYIGSTPNDLKLFRLGDEWTDV